MTLEEDEAFDLTPALSWRQTLTRCAEIVGALPIILLLLPLYAIVQVVAAFIRIYRMVRALRRALNQIADLIATTGIAAPKT